MRSTISTTSASILRRPGNTSGCSGLVSRKRRTELAMISLSSSPPWYTAPETRPARHTALPSASPSPSCAGSRRSSDAICVSTQEGVRPYVGTSRIVGTVVRLTRDSSSCRNACAISRFIRRRFAGTSSATVTTNRLSRSYTSRAIPETPLARSARSAERA